jgi:hypothetical protein
MNVNVLCLLNCRKEHLDGVRVFVHWMLAIGVKIANKRTRRRC